jgi:hypothetical protein
MGKILEWFILSVSPICAISLPFASHPELAQVVKDPDVILLEAVQRAFSSKMGPHNVEWFVGLPASINTLKAEDKLLISIRTSFVPDRDKNAAIPKLHKMKVIVYWIRPAADEKSAPKVVGICWDQANQSSLFFAYIK